MFALHNPFHNHQTEFLAFASHLFNFIFFFPSRSRYVANKNVNKIIRCDLMEHEKRERESDTNEKKTDDKINLITLIVFKEK